MPYPGYAIQTKPIPTPKGLHPRRHTAGDPNRNPLGFPKWIFWRLLSQGSFATLRNPGLENVTPSA
jgi:hypothetical protein